MPAFSAGVPGVTERTSNPSLSGTPKNSPSWLLILSPSMPKCGVSPKKNRSPSQLNRRAWGGDGGMGVVGVVTLRRGIARMGGAVMEKSPSPLLKKFDFGRDSTVTPMV